MLAECVQRQLNWGVRKQGKIWVNADGSRVSPSDYIALLEQGGFSDAAQADLMKAASGRIQAAIVRGQTHFDQMEQSHQYMLAGVLAAILYHRASESD